MPARPKIAMLPRALRTELERRIVERAFSGYRDLAEWLQGQGYRIAHDSLQRYGSRLQQKIATMEQLAREAKASNAAAHRASANLVNVTIQLIHRRVLSMLLDDCKGSEESSGAGVPACAPYVDAGVAGIPGEEPDSASGDADGSTELGQVRSEEPGGANLSPSVSVSDGGAGVPALADLVRLTRIVAELNRITIARQRQAEKGKSRLEPRNRKADGEHAEDEGEGLSEEAYQAIRNALLGIDPFEQDAERGEGSGSAGVPAGPPPSQESRGERNQGS
jgi:hypothetical protein